MLARIKQFWQGNERNIILVSGFILVAAISFEAGLLEGRENQQKPVIIEKTASQEEIQQNLDDNTSGSPNSVPGVSLNSSVTNTQPQNSDPQKCAFVGSKNSNKYHLPTCRWAKNIKPENIVCFSSAEDAVAKGYQSDKNCIK